ncbi:hypothetical protein STEG23_037506, partial [Scotinomys teguina]
MSTAERKNILVPIYTRFTHILDENMVSKFDDIDMTAMANKDNAKPYQEDQVQTLKLDLHSLQNCDKSIGFLEKEPKKKCSIITTGNIKTIFILQQSSLYLM